MFILWAYSQLVRRKNIRPTLLSTSSEKYVRSNNVKLLDKVKGKMTVIISIKNYHR